MDIYELKNNKKEINENIDANDFRNGNRDTNVSCHILLDTLLCLTCIYGVGGYKSRPIETVNIWYVMRFIKIHFVRHMSEWEK